MKTSDSSLVRRLWPYAKPVRLLLGLAAILMVAEELLPFAGPHLLKKVIDHLEAGGPVSGVHSMAALFLAAVLAAAFSGFLRAVAIENVSARIVHGLRTSLWRHVQGQGMAFFHKRPLGELMTRLNNDVDSVNRLLSEVVLDLSGSVLMIVFGSAYMLASDWRLALCCLLFLPPMLLATHIFRIKVRDSNREVRQELSILNTSLQENLSGSALVRIFGLEQRRQKEFARHNADYRTAWFRNVDYYSRYFPVLNLLTELATALLFLVGTWLFARDMASLGTLASFSWTMGMFFRPLRELSDRITNLQQSLTAAERVFSVFDERSVVPADGTHPLPAPAGEVEFRDVVFGYAPSNPVVKGISFTIRPGTTTALVGATGSGKSTLAALLARFHDPDSGSISVDGVDLRELAPHDRGKAFGIVLQEPYLFPGSLADNVALGRDVPRERIESLLREVRLGDLLDTLPQGMDTPVGERGARLSTGQRQLLSFARALCQDPAVLVLDEATASIDSQSEEALQEVTNRLLGERSALVIAHRLATIRDADEIIVLAHGEVRERGTHSELLEKQGLYARLWTLQGSRGTL
ncbi:MAG: ABC transporter ATP-binding protein [Fibrobacteria bacterium]|nr:ABC transporter ATP-binding protein [Fibrobacteria bacterium]